MPFTPLHLGPSSLIGLIFFKLFDFPTLLFASVIVDIEHFRTLIFGGPFYHIIFHNFLAGSVIAILTALFFYFYGHPLRKLMKIPTDNFSFRKILRSSFFGIYFHIILDSFLYPEMKPFYPLRGNPFFRVFSFSQIYLFSLITAFLALIVYLVKKSSSPNGSRN